MLIMSSALAAAPAFAQAGFADVSVLGVDIDPAPTVDQTSVVTAHIASTGAGVVEVAFRYESPTGPGIRDPGSPDGQAYKVTFGFTSAGHQNVSLPFAPTLDRIGPQEIHAVATLRGQAGSSTADDHLARATFVRYAALNVTFPNVSVVGAPNGTIFAPVWIRNDGNAPDKPNISAEADDVNWTVVGVSSVPEIPPGATAAASVYLRAARETPLKPGLNVTVRSNNSRETSVRALAPNLTVNDSALAVPPSATLRAQDDAGQWILNETRTVNITVRNTAERPQVYNVTWALVGNGSDWEVNWTSSNETFPTNATTASNATTFLAARPIRHHHSALVALAANDSTTLAVDVTRRANGSVAEVRLEVATPDLALYELDAGPLATLRMPLVPARFEISIELEGEPPPIYDGDRAAFRFSIANSGRLNASDLTLLVRVEDALQIVASSRLAVGTVEPSARTTIAWGHEFRGLQGPLTLTAEVARNDSGSDAVVARAEVPLVIRVPNIEIRAADELVAVPGTRLQTSSASSLSVINRGEQDEEVVVELTGGASVAWMNASWRVSVPARAVVPLPLDLEIPEIIGASRLVGRLGAHVAARPAFSTSADIVLDIRDDAPPRLVALVAPTAAIMGTPTEFQFEATDAIGIRSVELVLISPDGARANYTMSARGAGVHAGFIVPLVPGRHAIEVRAEDVGIPARASIIHDLALEVSPPVFRGLRPVVAVEGARVSVREVLFQEADPGKTREASYDVGFGRSALPSPFVVTLPPAEGPYTIDLDATSFHGARWQGSWNLTLDLTAPSILDATVDSATTTWRIRASAPEARSVIAEFDTPSGVVTVTLAPQGAGVFATTLPSIAEWEGAKFIAEDEAGNHGSKVVAANKEVPSLSLLLTILAVGTMASARGRSARGR